MKNLNRILYKNNNKKYAEENRKNLTLPERIMWYQLLNKSKLGFKFIRQYRIHNYILDFYSPELKINIELDGSSHQGQQTIKDTIRDQLLISYGVKVYRILNNDVLYNLDSVSNYLKNEIEKISKSVD
jgi:very-short-patch-repair endonuclease